MNGSVRNYRYLVFLSVAIVLTLGACASIPPHQSRAMPENPVSLGETTVISVVPTNELSVRRDFVDGKAPGSGYVAALCPICALPMLVAIAADKSSQEKSLAQEDATLLPTLRDQLGDKRTGTLWDAGLRKTVERAKDIHVSQVKVIDAQTLPAEASFVTESQKNKPLALLELDHYLSSDLDKLRMQVRARLFDGQGAVVSDQYYFYLPTSVGWPKVKAVGEWSANGGERYLRTAQRGVEGILDALQLTLFSYRENSKVVYTDAAQLLAKRNCFAGEYEVGIPLSAYDNGEILASRDEYSIIRLSNGDVLVMDVCNR